MRSNADREKTFGNQRNFREMNSALSIRKVPEHGRVSLTVNEWAWIDFIRLISYDSDPAPTLHRIQKLIEIFHVDARAPARKPHVSSVRNSSDDP